MNKFIVKILLNLHTKLYHLSSRFAKKVEGGTHPKHRLTQYHQFFVNNVSSNDSVLDIGCSKGELALNIARKAKKVIGIDIKEKSIEIARQKYSAPNIEYLVGDVTKSLPDQKFDVLILSNVLEHIENRPEFLNKIKNLGDRFLIRVPMINRDWITLYKKEIGVEWRLHNEHYIEYTMESFKEEIEQVGLRINNYSIQFGEIWAVITF